MENHYVHVIFHTGAAFDVHLKSSAPVRRRAMKALRSSQISRFSLDWFRIGKIEVRHCVQIAGLSDLRTWRGAGEISVSVSAAAECGFQK